MSILFFLHSLVVMSIHAQNTTVPPMSTSGTNLDIIQEVIYPMVTKFDRNGSSPQLLQNASLSSVQELFGWTSDTWLGWVGDVFVSRSGNALKVRPPVGKTTADALAAGWMRNGSFSNFNQTLAAQSAPRCGPGFNNAKCPSSGIPCCSTSGYCGASPFECALQSNCRPEFGKCGGPEPLPSPSSVPPLNPNARARDVYTCTQSGLFALTFDDGPVHITLDLLEILSFNNIKATFFINGYNRGDLSVDPYKSILQRMYKDGHQIATHTYSHASLLSLDMYGVWTEMARNDAAIQKVIGVKPIYFRPPFGLFNNDSLLWLGSWGYPYVVLNNADNWDTLVQGTADFNRLVDGNLTAAFSRGTPSSQSIIMTHHDILEDTIYGWVQTMVNRVKQAGYRFVTVGECLGNPNPSSWYR